MQSIITLDDICDEVESVNSLTMALLRSWYELAKQEQEIDFVVKRELERSIRGAIEGVTNLQLERIIIDLDRNDT